MTRQQLERVYLISAVGYGSISTEDQEAIRAVLHQLDALEKQVNLLEGRAKLTQSLTIEPLTAERDTLRAALRDAREALAWAPCGCFNIGKITTECRRCVVLARLNPLVEDVSKKEN